MIWLVVFTTFVGHRDVFRTIREQVRVAGENIYN